MKPGKWVLLGAGGLLVTILVAFFQTVPGYMDAEYYYAGGMRIANNLWKTEPFIWNYLDNPAGLPHVSFTYWMPLASVLAGIGMKLSGSQSFTSARAVFILLSAIIPIMTAKLTISLGGKPRQAWLAGWLAVFSCFYALYLGIPETFSISMILGCGLFLILASEWKTWQRGLAAGVCVGFLHLTRADGMLWLGVVGFWFWLEWRRLKPVMSFKSLVSGVALAFVAYLVVMSPWFSRNLQEWGSLMPPGGSRTLWLTNYDETYVYPAELLNFATWQASGIKAILSARLQAGWLNLQTLVGVQAGIALLPLMLIGGWRHRRNLVVQVGGLAWLGFFLLMTIIFPFAGSRGGFFHSGATLQPLLWCLAALGLEGFIDWGARRRGWQGGTAWNVFGTGLVVMMTIVTIFISMNRLVGAASEESWGKSQERYEQVEDWLREQGGEGSIVMVNNPPGYYVAGRRASLAIPFGEIQTVLEAASRYGADYLILEKNTTPQLKSLYEDPHTMPGLVYLTTIVDARIFQFEGTQP